MLRWVVIGCAALAMVITVRWLARPRDRLGRAVAFPWLPVALCLVLAGGLAVPVARHRAFERRLGAVSSGLAGRAAQVRCETLSQSWLSAHTEAGYVEFYADGTASDLATITTDTCTTLSRWVRSPQLAPSLDEVVAVHVLAHEAMHVAGRLNEAEAECAAVQRDALTAELLGASPRVARALAATYWSQMYPQLPENYRSGECRAGGSLDEGLAKAPWATGG